MNILYVTSDTAMERNSVVWRCEIPAEAINASGKAQAQLVFISDWVEGKADELSKWSDVIILQRNMIGGALTAAVKWMAKGKRVLLDLDDAYELMPQSVISARFWINNQHSSKPDDFKHLEKLEFAPLDHLRWGIKLVDGVITPSAVIAQDRRALTERVWIAPNYPRVKPYLEAVAEKKPNDKIVIGCASGGSHTASFLESNIVPALGRVAEARENVTLLFMGPPEVFPKIKTSKKEILPWVQYEQYPTNLAKLDIAVAPLFGGYDRRRSWIKAVEYSLMGIPWVGSDYNLEPQPYSGWKDHLIRNQAKYWEEALLAMVDNLDAYRTMMKQETPDPMVYDISNHVDELLAVYDGTADRRPGNDPMTLQRMSPDYQGKQS